MDRLKQLGVWLILVIAFWIFSNGLIYLMLNSKEIGMKIYNATYDNTEIVNEVE